MKKKKVVEKKETEKKRKYENGKFISIECRGNESPQIVGTACDFSVQWIDLYTLPSPYILQILAYKVDNHANGYRCWCHSIQAFTYGFFSLALCSHFVYMCSCAKSSFYRHKVQTKKKEEKTEPKKKWISNEDSICKAIRIWAEAIWKIDKFS